MLIDQWILFGAAPWEPASGLGLGLCRFPWIGSFSLSLMILFFMHGTLADVCLLVSV